MSRSYKKPFTTQGYGGNWRKVAKRLASKRVRNSVHVDNNGGYKRYYSSWDICDWSFPTEDNKKSRSR